MTYKAMVVVKRNIKNEKIKRDFIEYLEQAMGYSQSTIDKNIKAINEYETFSNNMDFGTFSKNKAIEYKNYLLSGRGNENHLSPKSQYAYLRGLIKFFQWLSTQAGYRSKINSNSIPFLNLDRKTAAIVAKPKNYTYPDLEYCKNLLSSIPSKSTIDLRDRAIISFLFCTGIRHLALTSLPIKCINIEELIVYQDPQMGVNTKFTKYIISKIFEFDSEMIMAIKDWKNKLTKMGYSDSDPFFPRAHMGLKENNLLFQKPTEVEPFFWKSQQPVCNMLKARAKFANLDYFPPHQFRHGLQKHIMKYCKDGQQYKAVSQHFGHEFVATTFKEYGNYSETELIGILKSIDCKDKPIFSPNDIAKIKQFFESVISEKQFRKYC